MTKTLLFLLLFACKFNQMYSQTYIMKTNHGGCDSYVNGNHIYEDDYEYKITDSNGNWLCPIAEAGEYLIFNQKPEGYFFASYKAETYSCSGGCGDYHSVGLTVGPINTCQNYIGSGIGYNRPDTPYLLLISNEVLAHPDELTNSFCDKISLTAVGCSGTQKFYWEYSTDGTNFTKINAVTNFNQSFEFVKANFPVLNNYFGNIFFRALIDSDPTITQENIYSNVVIYKMTGCSPILDGLPLASDIKCYNDASGSVTFKFQSQIAANQKLLISLYKNSSFLLHQFVKSNEILNNMYTWNGLEAGSYYIKYQVQDATNENTEFSTIPETSPTFLIHNMQPLVFTTTTTQPNCSTDKGSLKITASGGTSPYFYVLDNQKEVVNGQLVDKKIAFPSDGIINGLLDGDHIIKVLDSNHCIENL